MPYRLDLRRAGDDTSDRLIDLGALDIEPSEDGGLAALMPDGVSPDMVGSALDVHDFRVSPATGRDNGSVWVLSPGPVRVGRVQIVPAGEDTAPGALRLLDSSAFGTGLHPTTALCLEALQDVVEFDRPDTVLDVGTGSGVLALAALRLGVPRATGTDVDDDALRAAAGSARLNGLETRFELTRGGPECLGGSWPLVLANVLAAPLIEMAPALVRRVAPRGALVLSGIPSSVEQDVSQAYRRLGMLCTAVKERGGWVALLMRASW